MREGITMGAVVQTPEEKIAEARALLNRRVDQLQRNNGITTHSDLDITSAVMTIRALTDRAAERRGPTGSQGEKMITALADWHPISLLTTYLNRESTEYRRDHNQFGVYIMFEFVNNVYVPAFVEANPRYVGMSVHLSKRLGSQHLTGRGSTPAKVVTEQWLSAQGSKAVAMYNASSPEAQRKTRQFCIRNRGLWVQTTHTDSKVKALMLESAVTRLYEAHGIALWNRIKFKTTPPFRINHKHLSIM